MAPLDLDKYAEIAKQCKYLPENDLKRLCDYVCDLLLEESNVQPVSTPVTVCGDIHGQVKMESQNTLITDVSKQHVYTDS
uniref:Protein phosphatase 6 catalytic subunit n=1 Tax=Pundamilia nyererei TaxID=303518 RepID=A0A3B4FC30_9CICH